MPFLTYRNIPVAGTITGNLLTGMYRTLAAAQAAVATGGLKEGDTALTSEVADANIPANTNPEDNWFLYSTQTPAVQSTIDIQVEGSGKGFRLTIVGVDGADGNAWSIRTKSGLSATISVDTVGRNFNLPRPAATSLDSGAEYLALLNGLTGDETLQAEYLDGTDANTDLATLAGSTGIWRPFPDEDTTANQPFFFSGGSDGASVLGVHMGPEPTADYKRYRWMERVRSVYLQMTEHIQQRWNIDTIGRESILATTVWAWHVPATAYNFLNRPSFNNVPVTDEQKERVIAHIETLPSAVKIWYTVMHDDASKRSSWSNITNQTVYQDYIDSITGEPRPLDGLFLSMGEMPANYDPETLNWMT